MVFIDCLIVYPMDRYNSLNHSVVIDHCCFQSFALINNAVMKVTESKYFTVILIISLEKIPKSGIRGLVYLQTCYILLKCFSERSYSVVLPPVSKYENIKGFRTSFPQMRHSGMWIIMSWSQSRYSDSRKKLFFFLSLLNYLKELR